MSTALVKAASTAVSNRIIQQTATRAVKSAAPVIARAAASMVSSAVKSRRAAKPAAKKIVPTKSTKNTRNFAPVAYATNFTNSGRSVRISQSEIVADINPAVDKHYWPREDTAKDFTIACFPISPSNTTTFPWLSSIAGLFDKFRFRKLVFTFVSTRPTNTKGNIAMAVDFDAYDNRPDSVIKMSNLAKFTTTPVYVNKSLTVPLNHPGNKSWYYCDDGSSGDKKTYNLANFYLALTGVDDIKSHGYLIVDYDIELIDKNPSLTTVSTSVSDNGTISTQVNTSGSANTTTTANYFYHDINGDVSFNKNWLSMGTDSVITLTNLKVGDTVLMQFQAHSVSGDMNIEVGGQGEGFNTDGLEVSYGYLSGGSANCTFTLLATVTDPAYCVITPRLTYPNIHIPSFYITATAFSSITN
jgi:hypothetical protein